MKSIAVLLLALAVNACTSAAPSPTGTPTPTAAPTSTAAPTEPVSRSPYDGIWATAPLEKSDLAAALGRAGLDDSILDEWRDDWDKIGHWVFEFGIANGEWRQDEIGDGVLRSGWVGRFTMQGETTVLVRDEDSGCQVTYEIDMTTETFTVDLTNSDCPADDVALQTAMVEASPFHLVEAPDWAPPGPSPQATPGASAPADTTAPSTSAERQQKRPIDTVEGASLGYLEYLPPSYSEDGDPSPLLVLLHGSGESGPGTDLMLGLLDNTGIPMLIGQNQWDDARPFVVLSPQHDAVEPFVCVTSDEIDEFLRFALENYNVDPARVYVTGLSCGATGLWNYLGEYGAGLVAAAVPIAGFGVGPFGLRGCELGRTPVWAFHGARDDSVPVHGDAYPLTELGQCTEPAAVDARLTVYPLGGHHIWDRTYNLASGDDIYAWMLSHSL